MPARVSLPQTPNPSSQSQDPEAYSPKRGRPILFQVVSPGTNSPLYSYLLALHVNPEALDERMAASKTVAPTRGGWVEFRWPNELTSLSGDNTSGTFYSPSSGLSAGSAATQLNANALGRQGTMAWERQEDLLDLFHNNGMVFAGNGQPVIRGQVMMIYDRGIFYGYFSTFEVAEDDAHAWSFHLSWEFMIEKTLYRFPGSLGASGTQLSPSAPIVATPAPAYGSAAGTQAGGSYIVPVQPITTNIGITSGAAALGTAVRGGG